MTIYGEIVGERVALSKLAADKFAKTGRPFRVAVDISIWQYQVQSGRGGTNPALRTFYHRLVRLLSLSIQPLFVFDGLHKPPFKRGHRTSANTVSLPNFLMKQLLKLFGFPFIVARGEAEAEAALLQREGVVDAVFSEDVDTLMFGCELSMRNWSSEGSRGNKQPTHVTVYDASKIATGPSGLDREGMVLVALMSGGDYIPEGVPGCGIKVACEAARAGFGKSLLSIPRTDTAGFKTWRDSLAHELRSNASKFFRVKHNALQLPGAFPNLEVLGYYAQPMVSSAEGIQKLKDEIQWDGEVDIAGLRAFVADAFEWRHKSGAIKFIKGLAPALLVWKLRTRGAIAAVDEQSASSKTEEESIVKSLSGRRTHFTTDGTPEICVNYIPTEIVGLDLGTEERDNEVIEAIEPEASPPLETDPVGDAEIPVTLPDPTKEQKIWVGEIYVRMGVPVMFHDWEEGSRNRDKGAKAKTTTRKKRQPILKGGVKAGALEPFLKITKPGLSSVRAENPGKVAQPPSGNQSPKELDTQTANAKPAKSRNQGVKGKENGAKTISPVARAARGRSRRTNLGALPTEKPFVLANKTPKASNTPLSPKSGCLALGGHQPSEGPSDPRRSNRAEPHYANGNKELTLSKGARGASRRYGGPPPRDSLSVGSGIPRKHGLPYPEHAMEESLSGSITDRPSPSKGQTAARQRFRITAEGCIDLSESPPLHPRGKHQLSHSATSRFEGHASRAASAGTELNRGPGFSSSKQILPTQDQPAPSPPSPTSMLQPRHPPRGPDADFPPAALHPSAQRPSPRQEKPPVEKASLRPQAAARMVRMVAPRESLAGAWKEVDELEARTRSNVFIGVEILDMTGGL
ncbi:MAG: hypothetical protein M1839_000555 [Geoglossum umbratile]|nr:MAG: hypothetical protein M1839_000555 [Geoglossum umbratile]